MGLFSKDRERRRHPRFNKNISVHVETRDRNATKNQSAAADNPPAEKVGRDVSRGGLCFFSNTPYAPDTVLRMTIRIAGIKDESGRTPMYLMSSTVPVRADARVIWCKPAENGGGYEVGVSFEEIFGDDFKILQKNLKDETGF